ncbi:MAG: DUF502 domain-containing protein [Betaproteobacteria bacterium]|nr:DUF502 domain-containing protein [Betaproteobacteria bacterium]
MSAPRKLLNTFVAGALAALPLAATVLLLVWTGRLLYEYLGPGSLVGGWIQALGFGLGESEIVAWLVGVAIMVLAIFLLGVAVTNGLNRFTAMAVDAVVQRIPIVRNVYEVVKSLVDLFAQRDSEKLKSMSPVWLTFGGSDAKDGGTVVLGLLSTAEPVLLNGRPYLAVLIPTAPVPVGGGLLYVPAEWVKPADVGMEGVTSIYVSMGVTSAQHIGSGAARPPG